MDSNRVGINGDENPINNVIYASLLHSSFYKVTVLHCMTDPRFAKYFNSLGFVFFTNYTSRKAQHLATNPSASLLFPWYALERQVIVTGKVERIPIEESKAYFFSRPYGSQLGAWVSKQSSIIDSRQVLENRLSELKQQFSEGEVPFPDFWGGYRLVPESMEFWQGGVNRLHDRILYKQVESAWTLVRLSP